MNNKTISYAFIGAAILCGFGAMSGMLNGNYIMMILFAAAAVGLYFAKKNYEAKALKMSAGAVGAGSSQQYVTDPEILAKIKEAPRDPSNMKVNNLTKGSLLEYDLKTWEADDMRLFYWTEAPEDTEHEVEKSIDLKSGNKKMNMRVRVEKNDDQVPLTKPINVFQVDSRMNSYVKNGKFDPPTVLKVEGEEFYREGLKRGFNINPSDNSYTVFESWDYHNSKKSRILRVEYGGENDFTAQIGQFVNKYQFENLLPAPSKD